MEIISPLCDCLSDDAEPRHCRRRTNNKTINHCKSYPQRLKSEWCAVPTGTGFIYKQSTVRSSVRHRILAVRDTAADGLQRLSARPRLSRVVKTSDDTTFQGQLFEQVFFAIICFSNFPCQNVNSRDLRRYQLLFTYLPISLTSRLALATYMKLIHLLTTKYN